MIAAHARVRKSVTALALVGSGWRLLRLLLGSDWMWQ